jgi:hypothetical protein
VAREFQAVGVNHFVALRGDPPEGVGAAYEPHPEGYANGAELVAGLRAIDDFEISVSAYPERHPESPDFATDIDMLKRKVDAGATRAITQFFFDNDIYERYVERVRRAGIYIPIVPGILPIHNFGQVARFSKLCGASVPDWLARRFDGLEKDPETRALVAAAIAAEQVNDLVERGVDDFHFYTMNRAQLVYAICHMLGLRGDDAGCGWRGCLIQSGGPGLQVSGGYDKENGSAETLPSLNFPFWQCVLTDQIKSIAPTNMNAAQITRALSDCVNPMVVLHRVYLRMIGTGLGRGKQNRCCTAAKNEKIEY